MNASNGIGTFSTLYTVGFFMSLLTATRHVSRLSGGGRFPLSGDDVHRSLRFPDLRAGDDSPSRPRCIMPFQTAALPDHDRPRGSPLRSERPHPELDCDHAGTVDLRAHQNPAAMSLLQQQRRNIQANEIMTQ
jgi:hypothetical protein